MLYNKETGEVDFNSLYEEERKKLLGYILNIYKKEADMIEKVVSPRGIYYPGRFVPEWAEGENGYVLAIQFQGHVNVSLTINGKDIGETIQVPVNYSSVKKAIDRKYDEWIDLIEEEEKKSASL